MDANVSVAGTRTIIMQELLNEVYVSKNHASAAISFQLKFIESIPKREGVRSILLTIAGGTDPSLMSFARSSR